MSTRAATPVRGAAVAVSLIVLALLGLASFLVFPTAAVIAGLVVVPLAWRGRRQSPDPGTRAAYTAALILGALCLLAMVAVAIASIFVTNSGSASGFDPAPGGGA